MELLQLQYFITLAECQHMTRAANTLMVSQPSLSNTLSRIEKELEVKLFDRQGRNIVLNDYGKVVLQHAKNIFRELDNIHTEIDALKNAQDNTITIGSVDSEYVKDWLPFFITEHPNIFVHHSIGTPAELDHQLQNGDIDFAITDSNSLTEEYATQLLGHDEYIILSPLDNPIPNDKPQDFAAFRNEPFISRARADKNARAIDILSNAAGIKPNIIFEGEQALLSRIFYLGYGNLIAQKSSILTPQDRSICERYSKIYLLNDERANFDVNLVWDKNRSLSEAGLSLIDYIKNNTKQFRCTNADIFNNPADRDFIDISFA